MWRDMRRSERCPQEPCAKAPTSHFAFRVPHLALIPFHEWQSSYPNRQYQKIVISHGDHGLPCFRAIPDFSSLRLPLMENYYEVSLALVTHWPNLYSQSTHLPRGNYSAATSHRVEIMYVPCKAENRQTDRKAGGIEGRAPSHMHVYQRSCGVSTFHQTASQGFPPPFIAPGTKTSLASSLLSIIF